MKKFFALFLSIVCLMASFAILAQTPEEREHEQKLKEQAAHVEMQREELENLQKETVRALQLHNATFFQRVYSDDFLWTSPSGMIMDKAAYLSTVQSSSDRYSSFVVTDIRVRVFQDTAVVTCLWSSRGSSSGVPFSRQSRVITVYIAGQRGWLVVASQETQLPG